MITEASPREDSKLLARPEVRAAGQPGRSPSPSTRQDTTQVEWARRSCASRLRILKLARHELAHLAPQLAKAISPSLARTYADTMAAEILPLLEAVRFLEHNAPTLLHPRRLGRKGLPFWLTGIDAEIHRVPFGKVLIIGPSNYPLFLPGVQVFQALAAGNAAVWKPGTGGAPVAIMVAEALYRSGLPRELLKVTGDTIQAAQDAIAQGVEKVFFTGSGATGKLLLRQLAETVTPCVVELSGNDAAVILPSADIDRAVAALGFGLRFNGSATCMAPRRILLVDCTPERRKLFLERLQKALAQVDHVTLGASIRRQLAVLVSEAEQEGATVIGEPSSEALKPVLLLNVTPQMRIAQSDIFAPVLSVIDVPNIDDVLSAQAHCPLALTTSIFGDEREARRLAAQITSGTVTINDLIVPAADPRVPFGGRRESGFGVTRGAEGLLEMTAVKVISTRRSRSTRHYEPAGDPHAGLFDGIIRTTHASSLSQRWTGLKRSFRAAMELKKK